jgi:drug/metabolite transporter (DMT)-like permease
MANLGAALALMVNAFAWGVSWWPFRNLQDLGVHPLWATAMVYLVALVILLTLQPGAWRGLVHWPGLWALALAAGLTNVGFNWAVTIGDVVRVVLLFYLMPAWVVILAWPLLGEKPTAASLMRLALALAGVVIVLKTSDAPWPWPASMADWLALMGGAAFALTNILLRKLHHVTTSSSMLAMFGGSALTTGAIALVGMQQGMVSGLPAPTFPWLMWVAGLSLFILAGNVGLQYGATRLRANVTSIVMLSEVVFASGSAVLLGASEVTARILLGGAMILVAAVWSALTPPKDTLPN